MTPRRRRITTFTCDRCTATVAVTVKAAAWCTRCGRRMKPTPANEARDRDRQR